MRVNSDNPIGGVKFEGLKPGDVFEFGAYSFIKIEYSSAFNTFSNMLQNFCQLDLVTPCPRAELVLNPKTFAQGGK